jgi:hypothetical protein
MLEKIIVFTTHYIFFAPRGHHQASVKYKNTIKNERKSNNEALSHNHCCRGKAVTSTHSVYVYV